MLPGQAAHEVLVQRLGEPRIGDRCRHAEAIQLLGRCQRLVQAGAVGQDGDGIPLA